MQLDLLTLSAGDTPASHSALPGSAEAHRMTATSGRNICDLYASSGQPGSLGKMLLVTSAWGSTKCWLTWKERVTPGKRLLFQLAPSMPRTGEIESGLLPTPNTCEGGRNRSASAGAAIRPSLGMMASRNLWPTIQATDAIKGGKVSPRPWAMGLSESLGGHLNPQWVEWLMGYPEGWTDLEHSETP